VPDRLAIDEEEIIHFVPALPKSFAGTDVPGSARIFPGKLLEDAIARRRQVWTF